MKSTHNQGTYKCLFAALCFSILLCGCFVPESGDAASQAEKAGLGQSSSDTSLTTATTFVAPVFTTTKPTATETTPPISATASSLTTTATTSSTAQKQYVVFWGHTGNKIHIKSNCRTIKNGSLQGTIEQAKAAGHDGWCQICSKGWSDQYFLENGNPFI